MNQDKKSVMGMLKIKGCRQYKGVITGLVFKQHYKIIVTLVFSATMMFQTSMGYAETDFAIAETSVAEEMPSVAYNSNANELLVVYLEQRTDLSGNPFEVKA